MTTTEASGATHTLDCDVYHDAWDNSIAPRLTIASGDTVVFRCRDASNGRQSPAGRADPQPPPAWIGHPLTGPVAISGAEPGDTLEIEVLALETGSWGYTSFRKGAGLLSEDEEFAGPYLVDWDLTQDPTPFAGGVRIPQEPFLGVMGVAPAEPGRHSTMPPRRNAGNIDIKQLGVGSRIYIPVLVTEALFSCGDGHAAQGDGEVCVTAIECEMTATLRFGLHKGWSVPELQFQTAGPIAARTNTAGYYGATGHGPDLHAAAQQAVRHLIAYLVERRGFTKEDAYILCSVAADLKISEVVDAPNWIVSACLPLSIFPAESR
jgi:acetamidase/formamidase